MAKSPLDVDYTQFAATPTSVAGASPLNVDYAKFDAPPAPAAVAPSAPDPGVLDYAAVAGQGLLELPQQAGASFRRAISGMSGLIEEGESPEVAAAREANASFRAGVNARLGEDSFFGKMVDPASVASSATGLVGTGLVMASPFTGPAAPAVAAAGGTLAAASLPGMYRDVSYGTLAEAIRVEEAKIGRSLTAPERQALFDANASTFRREGAVEVAGEAVGMGASLLLSPAGGAAAKGFIKGGVTGAKLATQQIATRGAFRNAVGAGAAELTGEMIGETGTTVEQDINAQKLGLPNASLDRSFAGYFAAAKEVAPVVLGTAGLVGTVAGGTQKLADLAAGKLQGEAPQTRERALEVLKFKTENPDVDVAEEIVAGYIGGLPLTGEAPAAVAPSAPLLTEQTAAPLLTETQSEVAPAEVAPESVVEAAAEPMLELPAPVNISLPSGEVLPAQQFYRLLNERLDAQSGAMTKEEVIRSRRRLMKEEQQFFEVQAIQAVPEEQRTGAEKAKLTKYNNWLAETVPAEAVTEQKELVNDLSPLSVAGPASRQEVQESPVRVQGGEVATSDLAPLDETKSVNPLTTSPEAATLPENPSQGAEMQKPESAAQAIRSSFNALERKVIGSWHPIRASFNGTDQQFLANMKKTTSDPKKESSIHLANIKVGAMVKGDAPSYIVNYYKIDGKNNLAEEGLPAKATPEVLQRWQRNGLTLPALPSEVAPIAPVLTENPDLQPTPPTKEARIRAERQAQAAGLAPTPERRAAKEAKVEAPASAYTPATNKRIDTIVTSSLATSDVGLTRAEVVARYEAMKADKGQEVADAALAKTAETFGGRLKEEKARIGNRLKGELMKTQGSTPSSIRDVVAGVKSGEIDITGLPSESDFRIAFEIPTEQAAPVEQVEVQAPPAEQGTLPRLKRGYKRSTFTVADPVYKNYVFVEDVSPKGVTTLYTRKTGDTEVKAATPAIAAKVKSLEKIEAKFSEAAPQQLTLYRGDSVNADGLGKGSVGDLGKGLYFTDSAGAAEYFTDGSDKAHTREFTAQVRNPFDLMDRNLKDNPSMQQIMSDLPESREKALVQRWLNSDLDVKNTYGFLARATGNTPETFNDFLASYGFDAVVDQGVRGVSDGGKQVVVFGPQQVARPNDPITALAKAIQQETGQPVAAGTFTQVAPPRGQEALFAALAQTLGKEIVFFKNNGAPMTFNGATGIAEDTIYVNIDSAKPHLVVAGHEFLHDLKREEPETYAALRDVIMEVIPEKQRLTMWAGLNAKRQREGRQPIGMSAIDEELVADFFGAQFTSREFWAKVERRNPEGFAGLVQKLVAFLERIKAALTGAQREDIERAQTAAAEALARYVGKNPEAEYELMLSDLSTSPQFSELAQVIRGMTADLDVKSRPRVQPIEVNYETTGGSPAGDNAATQRRRQERQLFEAVAHGNSAVALGEATHALAAQVAAGKLSRDGAAKAFGAALSKANADSLKDIRSDLQAMGYVIPASGKEAVTATFIALGSAWQGYNTGAPQFSESYAAAPRQNLARLKDSLLSGRVTTQALPSVLKVTPLPILADVADTMNLPWVRTFYKATMQRDAVSNGIVTDFGLLGKELARTKETAQQIANVADVASIHQLKPQDDIFGQDWIAEAMRGAEDTKPETKESLLKGAQTAWEAAGMQKSTGKTFREAYLASRQAFDVLSEEQQEDYLRAVEMMKDLRQREKDAAQALIEEHTQDNPELRAEQIAQLDFAYNNLKGNYWPVYRKGDYTLDYVETATGLRGYSSFDTVFEREVVAKALVDAGAVDAATIKLSKKADTPPGSYGVPQGYNTALGKAIEDRAIAAATEGIDPKDIQAMEAATVQARVTAQETIQTLHEVWLRFQPEASAAKNMMRRKNIKGYDGDMVRGFLEYGQTHGVKVAQMEQGRRVERTINEMAAAIRGMAGDTTREMAILNDLRAREAVKSQPSHWLAKKLGAWTTFRYMTSPSIALVQMTQLGILTLPKLATLAGSNPTKAAGALLRGTQAAFSTKFTREQMFGDTAVQAVYDSLHEVVTTATRRENPGKYDDVPLGTAVNTPAELQALIDNLTPYQQQLLALQESMDRGLLDISLSHEVNEQVERKDMNPVTGKVFDLGMTFMRESEKASRKAAILAAFEVGGGGKDFFAGMETVAEVVDNTLFNYSKSAKGVALQGDLVRVLTTFQTFRINAAAKLFVLFRQTIRGETPEVQQAAKRELVGIFGMSGILAGTMGMPFAPLVFQLFDAIVGDDDDEPSEEQFRKWLAQNFGQTTSDVVAEGVPSLLGASLSRRIGLGDVVGSSAEMPARLVGDGALNWYATQLAGPSYSMVAGYAKGYNEIFNEGEIIKGLASSMPKPIGDALKAYGYARDGVKTGMGKRLLAAEQVGANEVLMQAFGFSPLEINRLKSEQYKLATRSTRLSMQWGQIKQDLVSAYVDGAPTDAAMTQAREFVATHPGLVQNAGAEIRSALRDYLKKDAGVDSRRESLLKR